MQYRSGTVSIATGSNSLIGHGVDWSGIPTDSIFAVPLTPGTFRVQRVVSPTEIELASVWTGAPLVDARYWITTDFTPFNGLPLPGRGDLESTRIISEALLALDGMVGGAPMGAFSVLDKDLNEAPASPIERASYIIGTAPTGVWQNRAGQIATFRRGLWTFATASDGAFIKVADENKFYAYRASSKTWELNPLTNIPATTWASITGKPTTFTPSAHVHAASDVTSGTFHLDRIPVIPASKISGVLSVDQIPVMPSQKQFAAATLAALTAAQQAEIGQGSVVTTDDGYRSIYKGSGSKTDPVNYTVLADITPEWDAISNRPTIFPSNIANVSGLQTELTNLQNSINSKSITWAAIPDKPTTLVHSNVVTIFRGGVGGSEGGEIHLAKPQSGTVLEGNVAIDVAGNSIRFIDAAGSARGAYIPLDKMGAGATSRIWTSSDFGLTTWADRIHGHTIADTSGLQAALDGKAGLSNTNAFSGKQTLNGGAVINGGLTVKDSLTMTGADPYMRRDNNSSAWVMAGGQGWTDTGAVIVLHGKDHATRPGDMLLYGVDGNATSNLLMDGWKAIYMNRRPSFAGATPWDSSNLPQPASKTFNHYIERQTIASSGGRQLTLKTDTNPSGGGQNYGLIHHTDASDYYVLLTNKGDANGTFNDLRPFRMSMATGDMNFGRHVVTEKELHAYGDTHLPSYTRLWDRGETGYTVLEYRRQASAGVVGAHTFVSGSNDNTNYTVSVFKNGNTSDRSDLILDYSGGFSWRGKSVWTGHNFDPNGKVSWTDTNMDGGAYTVVRRNGDGGGFFTGRLHAYSQTATNDVWNSGIEIQEVKNVGNTQSGHAYAPALTFHWKNVCARSLWMGSDAWLYVGTQGDKSNLGNLGVNRISSDGNELWLQKNKVTKLKIHEYGINAIGNCDVDGNVYIRGSSPTVYFQDNDERSGMIHVNGNWMYFLRGAGTNSTGWESTNGGWPLQLNLDNNDAHFGGNVYAGTNRWFRVRQNNDGTQAGIYWETWGGGWFMQDASWMRVYQDKNVVTGGEIQANDFVVTSDRRLKTNIVPLTGSRELIQKTETKSYEKRGRAMVGLIAQEVQEYAPHMVREGGEKLEDGTPALTLDLMQFIPHLLAEVKALRQEVETLKAAA